MRRVKEGTSAVLQQSGLDENWWSDSVECYCYLRNIQDFLSDGKTPYERRFGKPIKGPIIPFGSLVEYDPISAALCRRRIVLRAENFGDLITADHQVPSEGCESRNNHRYAVVVQDLATQWIQGCPCKTRTSQETQRSLLKFLEPERKPKVIYIAKSLEFGKACEDLSWNHSTSTPHRSQTNGIAERAVRRVKAGTPAVLLQSGLAEEWWTDSMECNTYLRNIQDLLTDGKRPNMKDVLGNRLKDQLSRLVHWLSITLSLRKSSQESINLERKSHLDLFLGYSLYAGGTWKGDIMVADVEELETVDASEIYSKRLNAKEVIIPKMGKQISSRRWTNQIYWVRSGTENTHLDTRTPNSRRESHRFSWRIRRVSTSTQNQGR